ncbi:MAG: hypothetical protein ACTHZ7_14825 [Sphingobacterium sp.]
MKHAIPEQFIGKEVNASRSITLNTPQEATDFFNIVRNRLLDVGNWYRTAKLPLSTFELVSSPGSVDVSSVRIGDYIKINIPGPGPSNPEHVDYVRVEDITETEEQGVHALTITLRPSTEPTAAIDSDVQHFFSGVSTSTLQILRDEKTITASYFGRNEVVNTDVASFSDKVRNVIVGWAAKLGLSFPQWDALVSGMVDDKILKGGQEMS